MRPFEFNTTPFIKFGPGCLDQLGEIALKKLGKKILIVTDKGIVKAGIIDKALKSLQESDVKYTIFSDTLIHFFRIFGGNLELKRPPSIHP